MSQMRIEDLRNAAVGFKEDTGVAVHRFHRQVAAGAPR